VADFRPVVALAERAWKYARENPGALTVLGGALLRTGCLDEARKRLEEAVSRQGQGGYAEMWLFMALVEAHSGQAKEARSCLAKAHKAQERFPYSSEMWQALQVLEQEAEVMIRNIRARGE
jgi:hypothetical protein